MSPRAYDRYMLQVGAGKHVKFRRLTIPERYAFFNGVLSLAARSPVRGCLMIGNLPVEPADVAAECDATEKTAETAMGKLRSLGILEADGNGFEWVHDFEDYNPAPKEDRTAADRQRRKRDRERASRRDVTVVTPRDTVTVTGSHAEEVEGEVEVEEEGKKTTSLASEGDERHLVIRRLFAYWQTTCDHPAAKFTSDRRSKLEARLREGYSEQDIRDAIDGAARAPYVNDAGKTFDDLELICRTGSKLEDFMKRTTPGRPNTAGDPWLENLLSLKESA